MRALQNYLPIVVHELHGAISAYRSKVYNQLTDFLPNWFVSGVCLGILLCFGPSRMLLTCIILYASYLTYRALYAKKPFYSFILFGGLLFGAGCTYLHGYIILSRIPTVSYGPSGLLGKVDRKKSRDRYDISLYSMRDEAGVMHTFHHGQKVVLRSERELRESSIINCLANITPVFQTEGVLGARLFFDKVIGFGSITKVNQIEESTNPIRSKLQAIVGSKFDQMERKIIEPVLFGTCNQDPRLADLCKKLGISHIFAISGLHFTIFGGIFYILGRWLFAPILCLLGARLNMILFGHFCAGFGVLYYLLIANPSWSVLRSALSSLLVIVILLLKRQTDARKTVIIALLIILTLWPHAILDIGFQLSFIAVLTLLYTKGNNLISTVAVSITTLPYLLYTFGYASLQPFIPNLVCAPFFSVALMPLIGFASLVAFIQPLPFLISKTIAIFIFLVDLCSKILVFELHHLIPPYAAVTWTLGLGIWLLTKDRFLLSLLSVITVLLSLKVLGTQILISRTAKEIVIYDNKILWSNAPQSFFVFECENSLKPSIILPLPEEFRIDPRKYMFDDMVIELSRLKKVRNDIPYLDTSSQSFVAMRRQGKLILRKWDVISQKRPVRILLSKGKFKISRD